MKQPRDNLDSSTDGKRSFGKLFRLRENFTDLNTEPTGSDDDLDRERLLTDGGREGTVLRYEEQRNDEGDVTDARVTVQANERPVSVTGERVDGRLVLKGVNDQSTTLLEREAISAFRAAVEELERRGIDLDLAGLAFAENSPEVDVEATAEAALEVASREELLAELDARGLNPGRPDDSDEAGDEADTGVDDLACDVEGCDFDATSPSGLAIHETKAHGDSDEECWCGICGAGPFDSTGSLGGHHSGAGHHGDAVPMDHEPDPFDLEDAGDADASDDPLSETPDGVVFVSEVPEIGSAIAKRLREAGYETAADIRAASVEELTEITYVGAERAQEIKATVDDYALSDGDEGESNGQDDAGEGEDDLEESIDGQHDDEDDEGDVLQEPAESDKKYPRECECGTVCEGRLEYDVHRVEEHGAHRAGYPDPGEFETIVEEAESLPDIQDATGWSSEKSLRMLGIYGLMDAVGGGDVTLSDLSEFEFEGIDADGAGDPELQDDRAEDPEPTVATDGQGEPVFVQEGVDPNDLVDALDGAASATDVGRALGIPETETVGAILRDLDLFDELSSTGALDRPTAEAAVRGVVADV